MTTEIRGCVYDPKRDRLAVSVYLEPGDSGLMLLVDGEQAPGDFVATWYGYLYRHPTNPPTDPYGLPLGYGPHVVAISYVTRVRSASGSVSVGNPPSTFGKARTNPNAVLELLWRAGWRTEQDLLDVVSIPRGESNWYTSARNWLPSTGFRPVGTVVTVEGPAAAWNQDHSQQGHCDRGLFQFNTKAWPNVTDAVADDPVKAVAKVRECWLDPKIGLTPWGFGAGASHYEQFWPELRPIVQAFIRSKA